MQCISVDPAIEPAPGASAGHQNRVNSSIESCRKEKSMSQPLSINGINHVELIVGNAKQAAFYYRNAVGFEQFAYLGPETGHRDRVSYALRQGDIVLVLTSPLTHMNPMTTFLALHGDSVRDVCFEVDNVDAVFQEAVERGAEPEQQPADLEDDNGTVRKAAVKTYGECRHSLICTKDYSGPFLPGFKEAAVHTEGAGLVRIDHIVGNVELRQMDRWADFYIDVFGFDQFVSYDDKDIHTDWSALQSKVVASKSRHIKFPINEPAKGLKRSQIQEYLDFHLTAGVQHIAMYTDDIVTTVSRLRERGVVFLDVPDTYYDTIWDRVGEIDEDREKIRKLSILVDRDDTGYLLQLFTMPVQDRPTLFLEIIQRCGCESFGIGNFRSLFEAMEREQSRRGNL
jgi:4-hydroxyphenylpyruvate dioxygenase